MQLRKIQCYIARQGFKPHLVDKLQGQGYRLAVLYSILCMLSLRLTPVVPVGES